jgi:bacteriocin-like protein
MTYATNTGATSEQAHKSTGRELTMNEELSDKSLSAVTGGTNKSGWDNRAVAVAATSSPST